MKDEILFSGKWIELRKKDDWFEYVHFKPSKSQTVAVLIYDSKNNNYLARFEKNPAQTNSLEKLVHTTITGACDKADKSPIEIAQMEILEEAGIECTTSEISYFGVCNVFKASDIECHLFSLDASNKDLKDLAGDGSRGEEGSKVEWLSEKDFFKSLNCPISSLIYAKMKNI